MTQQNNLTPMEEVAEATLECEPDLPHRILVVDDEPDIRRLNTELLLNQGYEVESAEDGVAAWAALQLNDFDLLVTDHKMPKVTGVDLLKLLHAAGRSLPTILVTAEPPMAELKRHPWLQVEAMLLKPYTADELLAKVRNVLFATDRAAGLFAPPPARLDQPPDDRVRF